MHATNAAPSTKSYSGTSPAFSASANPNEDWTKISDLAGAQADTEPHCSTQLPQKAQEEARRPGASCCLELSFT
ncbi:hypothetical protein Alg130_11493 [Pyrenophora tritici-repentis]|nr:hypothetical protein Alg130_11493 [Pyrenophora tritici-repentis]